MCLKNRQFFFITISFIDALSGFLYGSEKHSVYVKVKEFNVETRSFLKQAKFDSAPIGQIRRASLSIVLNIKGGTGRFLRVERRIFFVI